MPNAMKTIETVQAVPILKRIFDASSHSIVYEAVNAKSLQQKTKPRKYRNQFHEKKSVQN